MAKEKFKLFAVLVIGIMMAVHYTDSMIEKCRQHDESVTRLFSITNQIFNEFNKRCMSHDILTPAEELDSYLKCINKTRRVTNPTKKHVGLFTFLTIKFVAYQYGLMIATRTYFDHLKPGVPLKELFKLTKFLLDIGQLIPHVDLIEDIKKELINIPFDSLPNTPEEKDKIIDGYRNEITIKILNAFNNIEETTIDPMRNSLQLFIDKSNVTELQVEDFVVDHKTFNILYTFFGTLLYGTETKALKSENYFMSFEEIEDAAEFYLNTYYTPGKTWITQFIQDQELKTAKKLKPKLIQKTEKNAIEFNILHYLHIKYYKTKTKTEVKTILKFMTGNKPDVPEEDYKWTGTEELEPDDTDSENPESDQQSKKMKLGEPSSSSQQQAT